MDEQKLIEKSEVEMELMDKPPDREVVRGLPRVSFSDEITVIDENGERSDFHIELYTTNKSGLKRAVGRYRGDDFESGGLSGCEESNNCCIKKLRSLGHSSVPIVVFTLVAASVFIMLGAIIA